MKNNWFLAVILLFILSCAQSGLIIDEKNQQKDIRLLKKEKVLIIIVENNAFDSIILNSYYKNFLTRPLILNFLSDVLATDKKILSQYNLNDILDIFGEKMVIDQIVQNGARCYDKIIALNDEKASYDNFLKVLNSFNSLEHIIDIVIDLHANTDVMAFANNEIVQIERLISEIKDVKKIRSVYQTCCYGSSMMEEWIAAGVQAVNGAAGENSFVFYSPAIFLNAWMKGRPFAESVQEANIQERILLERLIKQYLFKEAIPIILSEELLVGGAMSVFGDNYLMWN